MSALLQEIRQTIEKHLDDLKQYLHIRKVRNKTESTESYQ